MSLKLFLLPMLLLPVLAFASNRDAAIGYEFADYAVVRIHADPAQDLRNFLSTNPNKEPASDNRQRLTCNSAMCGFILAKDGNAISIPNIDKVKPQQVAEWDQKEPPKRGAVQVLKPKNKPGTYKVLISGIAAQFLFDFLDQQDKDSPYDIKISALQCSREPVSNTYECSFRVAENGTISP